MLKYGDKENKTRCAKLYEFRNGGMGQGNATEISVQIKMGVRLVHWYELGTAAETGIWDR